MNSLKGALVPDETMVNLISSELKNLGDEPWLLDGFPRTIAQAEALQKETPVNVVINLDVPFDTIIDRVKGKKYYSHTGSYLHVLNARYLIFFKSRLILEVLQNFH